MYLLFHVDNIVLPNQNTYLLVFLFFIPDFLKINDIVPLVFISRVIHDLYPVQFQPSSLLHEVTDKRNASNTRHDVHPWPNRGQTIIRVVNVQELCIENHQE